MMKIQLFILLLFSLAAHADMTPIREVFSPPSANYPSSQFMKVAVLQWSNKVDTPVTSNLEAAEKYKQSNRETIAQYIREAAKNGAKLFVTPELAVVGYPDIPETDDNFESPQQAMPYAETVNGKSFLYFSSLARELRVYLHIGYLELDPTTKNLHNSLMVIDGEGKLKTNYRKQNLFWGEDRFITPGNVSKSYYNAAGKIGLAICADIYDNDVMDVYAESRLDALVVAASWSIHNSAYNFFARAAEWVNAIVIAANQNYFPDAGVVNRDGSVQSHIRQSTGLAYGYLPLKK